jgi:hypothetical protein
LFALELKPIIPSKSVADFTVGKLVAHEPNREAGASFLQLPATQSRAVHMQQIMAVFMVENKR